ncbi:MAG: CoB--CoM heterodisulfide reductase iron-sulfur subunit A family protein [Candidatus Lokiarchaeota archaeon]|nr:CoB--CoM heterodisulfide reductase iron-sulfur subunit A family protein [Candidatus Lokiarchaeota archaeon]
MKMTEKIEKIKVGVFICHCGSNIGGVIDINELATQLRKEENISTINAYTFMCSEQGQQLIRNQIKQNGINRIVIAACSPKLHEATFQKVLKDEGLNPFYLDIANIREQCSWVHSDEPEKASEKAAKLIKAAAVKAMQLEPVQTYEQKMIPEACIIGGGIAGIQAALDLSQQGFKVHLIERAPSIGGNMARAEKTFPTNDCAMCILSPKLNEVRQSLNILLYTYSEVRDISGYVGNFKIKIEKKPRFVNQDMCNGCGSCMNVCPVIVPDEWQLGMGVRKAIYIPFPQATPLRATINKDDCIECELCKNNCNRLAIDLDQKSEFIEINVGVIIVASGWEEWDPSPMKQYHYRDYENVITQFQLARLLDHSGPTQGELLTYEGKQVKKIVMIQCVGSRDENFYSYCSNVCCMAAIKHATLIKMEQNPNIDIYVCGMDIRTPKKLYEEYWVRSKHLGVKFIRGKPAEILRDPISRQLYCIVEDIESAKVLKIAADLFILSVATKPVSGIEEIAKMAGIDVDEFNFFRELHPKLAPIDTKTQGVFICGSAQGPKDIPDSIAQGSAAASRASILLSKPYLIISRLTPKFNFENCVFCLNCVNTCPFNALSSNNKLRRIFVNPALCMTCGICSQNCPTGACELLNYKDKQIISQIKELGS